MEITRSGPITARNAGAAICIACARAAPGLFIGDPRPRTRHGRQVHGLKIMLIIISKMLRMLKIHDTST